MEKVRNFALAKRDERYTTHHCDSKEFFERNYIKLFCREVQGTCTALNTGHASNKGLKQTVNYSNK